MLQPGVHAPGFELPDAEMDMVKLSSFKGKQNVVLYFYPKDDTPGCTLQGIEFSDLEDAFRSHDAVVFGISRDDCMTHAAFRDKHGLSVRLLSDSDSEVCTKYGVLQERIVDGRPRVGIVRSTFIIDKQGVIRHALPAVSPRGHAAEVLGLVREMAQSSTKPSRKSAR